MFKDLGKIKSLRFKTWTGFYMTTNLNKCSLVTTDGELKNKWSGLIFYEL
jgi:hypothetical protein